MVTIHLITPEYPPKLGGVADYTRLLAVGLAGAGDEVHVWTAPPPGKPTTDAGVTVHATLGTIRPGDLWATDRELNRFPEPRHLVVQYEPHGYRLHGMNLGFATWVARRATIGDRVDVMFHEAFQRFLGRPRHYVMAAVQRVMACVLLRSANRVWVSTPSWAEILRPYAPRKKTIRWLPIPSNVPSRPPDPNAVPEFAVGHFGTYWPQTVSLLGPLLFGILTTLPDTLVRLIGANGDRYLKEFSAAHPTLAARVSATGAIPLEVVREELHRCAVMVQPMVNGVTVRNGTVLACLANGRPVVGTAGRYSEAIWGECGGMSLTTEGDAAAGVREVVQLLADPAKQASMSRESVAFYARQIQLADVVSKIRDQ